MDSYYNVETARNALEQLASENTTGDDKRLANFVFNRKGVKVEETAQPTCWRLVKATPETDIAEIHEIVLTVQGALVEKRLPPFNEGSRRAEFLKQEITLGGLGSATFQRAIAATHDIYAMFEREFPDGLLDEPDILKDVEGLGTVIHISNRLLTPRKDAPDMEAVKMEKGVDPRGILRGLTAGDDYVHGEDNHVDYYSCEKDEEGNRQFQKVEPKIFRVGDLVQVEVSFVTIPRKGGKRTFKAILRTIALVDETFAKDAMLERMKDKLKTTTEVIDTAVTRKVVKRKTGYEIGPAVAKVPRKGDLLSMKAAMEVDETDKAGHSKRPEE